MGFMAFMALVICIVLLEWSEFSTDQRLYMAIAIPLLIVGYIYLNTYERVAERRAERRKT